MRIIDTIEEYSSYISSCGRKNKTVVTNRLYLNLFKEFLQKEKQKEYIHELSIKDVMEYTAVLGCRQFLGKRVDGRSLNNHISVIKLFLNYCDALEYCNANTSIIRNFSFKRNKIQGISQELYTQLFDMIKKQQRKEIVYRDLLLFGVGLFCGLRNSEARSIKFSDFERGFMIIEGKSKDNREVIFPEIMQEHARNLKKEREKGYIQYNISLGRKKTYSVVDLSPNTVFTSLNSNYFGHPLSIHGINGIIEKYKRLLGVDQRITYHQFRHTYATNFANMGVPVKVVGQLMGHVHESTTMLYYDLVDFRKLSLYSEQYFKKYDSNILSI